eukprot:1136319-Pelagomonas_calceolata.AAC.6
MSGMHTNKHHEPLSLCVKAFSRGQYGSSLIGMGGFSNERLLDQGIQVPERKKREVYAGHRPRALRKGPLTSKLARASPEDPENISRAIPDWVFPDGTGSPARHQSRPDALFVRSIPGRQANLDPSKIPPRDRDIHLVELKFCPDTKPSVTLETATAQHAHALTRLQPCSSRNPNRNNKVTLHIILIGVAGNNYNEYTITPLMNLGLTKQKGLRSRG